MAAGPRKAAEASSYAAWLWPADLHWFRSQQAWTCWLQGRGLGHADAHS